MKSTILSIVIKHHDQDSLQVEGFQRVRIHDHHGREDGSRKAGMALAKGCEFTT